MPLIEYMGLCLGHPEHGYYITRDPLGAAGDFITAPEISQMFGELIGAWVAQVWHDIGAPAPFVLAELGPGRGTLMRDVLRAAGRLPGFAAAAGIWLVETSPALQQRQAETLTDTAVHWADDASALPPGPMILLANEFLDALPIRQFQRTDPVWRERQVALTGGKLGFVWGPPRAQPEVETRFPEVADGTIVELAAPAEAVAARLGARIAAQGGAALFIDYGTWDGTGDTLQAVAAHRHVDPLTTPGAADLTTHVRFRALAEAAHPARAHGCVAQGLFLERLGITERALRLARGQPPAVAADIATAHRRLTHPEEMGNLFQVLALTPEDAPVPPGFAP